MLDDIKKFLDVFDDDTPKDKASVNPIEVKDTLFDKLVDKPLNKHPWVVIALWIIFLLMCFFRGAIGFK